MFQLCSAAAGKSQYNVKKHVFISREISCTCSFFCNLPGRLYLTHSCFVTFSYYNIICLRVHHLARTEISTWIYLTGIYQELTKPRLCFIPLQLKTAILKLQLFFFNIYINMENLMCLYNCNSPFFFSS